jgi:CIC family chloride channel protein
MVCAAAASLLGRLAGLSPRSVQRLVPVGMAAGIAAAFNAPIAAVTFTIEEVVGALDQTVLSGVVIAAAMAAVIERSCLGSHPIMAVSQTYGLDHPSSLLIYGVLGVTAGFVSIAFTDALLGVREGFRRLRKLPGWAQPAIGGLATGLLAVAILEGIHLGGPLGTNGITSSGYDVLGMALAGKLGVLALLALLVAKLVATVMTYSSGGPGGIFAPTLFFGAMLGGLFGMIDMHGLGHGSNELGAFAMVGMGAVFAGVIRAPITSVLIIFEMTGSYGLVLPLMITNMTAYALARHWRPAQSYDALLVQDGIHLPHHGASPASALERLRVSAAMTREVVTLSAEAKVADAGEHDFSTLPVVNEAGRVVGLVPLALLRAEQTTGRGDRPVASLTTKAVTIDPDDTLADAAVAMNDGKVRLLVVVDPAGKPLGVLTMSDLVRAHAAVSRAEHEEHEPSGPDTLPA